MLGIDYASVDQNRPPDFAAAYAFGVRFVVVRGAFTDGGRASVDPSIARDRAAINAAGLQFGAYMILGWNVDCAAQVAAFVQAYGAVVPGDLPPALDVEFPHGIAATGLTPRTALDQVEAALAALQATYPTVMIYTSARVWQEDLQNIASDACARCPQWIKVAYPWARRQAPHVTDVPATFPLPPPATADGAAGAFIEQFQGDALRVPGFTSTIDLNVFRNYIAGTADPRTAWMAARLTACGYPCAAGDATSVADSIRGFQRDFALGSDAIVGPRTWALLCNPPPRATDVPTATSG